VPPLTLCSRDLFDQLRAFLIDSYYSQDQVCKRLNLKHLQDYLTLRPNPVAPHTIGDRLDLLARLFLIGEIVEEEQMRSWVPTGVRQAMDRLGVIAQYPGRPEHWFATTALYPAYGVYIVSDRWTSPELAPIREAVDVVYPAVTADTARFVEALPADPCESLLDLCSGSGVAALIAASRYAARALSSDITEASVRCAEFNRRLNGIENLAVTRGDLYEAAGDETFDRIVANPPYMPSLKPAEVYAYGGELGDQITRRIVEGLPQHLRPGGRFYCMTVGPDVDGEGFERRLRSWLGESGREFDVFFFERQSFDPVYIAYQQAAKTRGGREEVEQWKELARKHHVENLVYGSVVIQRKTGASEPVTVRRRKGPRLTSAEIEWLRLWETKAADGGAGWILESQPVAAGDLDLRVIHRLQEGELAPQEFTLETKYPFEVECAIQPWAAFLIARCDGKTPARELLAYLKQNELVAADEPEEAFSSFLRSLISGGFLEIEGFRLPEH